MAATHAHYAAVCFPDMASADRDWIENIRQEHDAKAALIQAHLTVVFPQTVMAGDVFNGWIEHLAVQSGSTSLRLSLVRAAPDPRSSKTYVFLMPDGSGDGYNVITDLHRRAYDGVLRDAFDTRVPYHPHVTVGAFAEEKAARAVTDALSRSVIDISCEINAITVVQVKGDDIRIGDTYPLSKDDLAGLGRDR